MRMSLTVTEHIITLFFLYDIIIFQDIYQPFKRKLTGRTYNFS